MKTVVIQFSPTGGTARAAEALCSGLGEVSEIIDLVDPEFESANLAEDAADAAVIAVPSFGGLVPGLAAERLGKVTAAGMPCVLLAVYGNRAYDDTLVQLNDLADASGFKTIAAVAAIAEHSIIREFAAGRPDATDVATLADFGQQIAQKITAGADGMESTIPGNPEYVTGNGGGGPYPKADGKCNKCGACAAQCPTGALNAANPKAPDTNKCASCMRCVSTCPRGARKIGTILTIAVKKAIGAACAERKECELYL